VSDLVLTITNNPIAMPHSFPESRLKHIRSQREIPSCFASDRNKKIANKTKTKSIMLAMAGHPTKIGVPLFTKFGKTTRNPTYAIPLGRQVASKN